MLEETNLVCNCDLASVYFVTSHTPRLIFVDVPLFFWDVNDREAR